MFKTKLSHRILTLLWDARFSLFTCILTGLRALSEVGAIIIVGGNIIHYTRVMTTQSPWKLQGEIYLLRCRLV